MNARRVAGAVTGGLLAGLTISAVMLVSERLGGKPSELIELERKTAAKLDLRTTPGKLPPTAVEQAITHGGHLALSALAGLVYAAIIDEEADGVLSGAAFGVAFFIAAYGVTGPAFGVTRLPWREEPLRAVQHPVVHTLFGVTTALFARRATAGLRRVER